MKIDPIKYNEIINHERHVSEKHPLLGPDKRAAQFAPFAALTGFDDDVKETARQVDEFTQIDEDEREMLDRKIQILNEYKIKNQEFTITYFEPDDLKDGGKYVTKKIVLKDIDPVERILRTRDNQKIELDLIVDINSDIFAKYF